ncbi:MAG TPA: LLM class flavin-dependent oxidoreductase [Bacilli bacterium]|nr:LLM class flavin-dependent oxidoreductase [Bacilli bacterium]
MADKTLRDIPLSVLDLCPVVEGRTAADSFRDTLDLAQQVERLGFHRYWLAEHHNMPAIASAATSLLISHVAAGTSTIRVGSGGIMLPNHAPLVIAEQFGTLETLYPGRIDLGLGRAPGTDQLTAYALRRDRHSTGDDFPDQLAELRAFFDPSLGEDGRKVHAYPGEGLNIPIWLLGSSGFSAQLAGRLGLPFAFASHFSPEYTLPAMELYRSHFQPSETMEKPYAMVAVNVFAAETDEQAAYLATTMQQSFLNLIRNTPKKLQPPVEDMSAIISDYERSLLQQRLNTSIIGSPETVKRKLEKFLNETQADELMIHSQFYDHGARIRSYEIVADLVKG